MVLWRPTVVKRRHIEINLEYVSVGKKQGDLTWKTE